MSPRLSDLFLSSQSDERLVSLAQAGHERAFVAIVERYRPELLALARRLCPDGRAEDVVQQVFLSAFAALRSGAEVKHLRGWLYRIARNAATRSRAPLSLPLDGGTASAESVEDIVEQRAVAMAALAELARLPTRQRQAMVDSALAGMPRAEVASSMGLTEGAVRQLVHRARMALRTAVTAVTPWPVARWFAAMHSDVPGPAELTAGAGVASTGGVTIKLGALLASGTLVTGVAAVDLHRALGHHAAAHSAAQGHTFANAGGSRVGTVASSGDAPATLPVPTAAPQTIRVALRTNPSPAPGDGGTGGAQVRGARQDAGSGASGPRHAGRSHSGRLGGAGPGGGESSSRHRGEGGPSSSGSSSGRRGDGVGESTGSNSGSRDGGRDSGAPSGAIGSGSRDGHGDQMVSESHKPNSGGERSAPGSGGGAGGSSGGSGRGSGESGGGSAGSGHESGGSRGGSGGPGAGAGGPGGGSGGGPGASGGDSGGTGASNGGSGRSDRGSGGSGGGSGRSAASGHGGPISGD